MRAYKCDRCNKYYDEYYIELRISDDNNNFVHYELCEECFEKLKKFLNNK